jgi:DNA primase
MASPHRGRISRDQVIAALDVERFYASRVKGPLTRDGSTHSKTLCPFHPDTDPSFSIERSTGLFNCFGCGAAGSVFDFEMKLRNVDFPTALKNLAREAGLIRSPAPKPDPEVTYDYRDERGQLLYQTCRVGHGKGKKIWQRRPEGKGGWIDNIKGVRRVLYQLPDLLAAPDETVWSPEGEKDCDTLLNRGLLATTSVCGAKVRWTREYAETLRGRHVRIPPDNDDEGRKHAEHKANILHGIAASVKIVELPGLPHKGDITDWFEAGHTVEELEALAEAAPEWQPTQQADTDEPDDEGDADTASHSGRPSQADRMVKLVLGGEVTLFHDQLGDGMARVRVGNHWEIWRCRSKDFRRWLARGFWQAEGKAANAEALNSAINVIEATARFDGAEHALHNRVAWHDGAIWYDLADADWRAVRIRPAGWETVAEPPILFRRYAHQRPQVEPARGGDLRELLRFVNLRDPAQQALLLAYAVSCVVPDIQHPIPVVHGGQGTAKTTLLCVLRRLIDPSAVEILSLPHDHAELVQQLSHHWAAYYDNITMLPDSVSEAFCRAVTGSGFSKRELYSDDDDVIYYFRRCIGLNGINVAAHKADLLDRCILIGLDPILSDNRIPEQQFWRRFEEARTRLMGAIFDVLSRAMALHPAVELPQLPRMADFALWGCAITEALGRGRNEFLCAFDENAVNRNDEVLQSNPVAAMVVVLMEDRDEWTGSASELYAEVVSLAQVHKIDTRAKSWPKAPEALTRRLNEVAANLAAAGIHIDRLREGQKRWIVLRKGVADSVIGVISVTEDQSTLNSAPSDGDAIDDGREMPSPVPSRDSTPSRAQNGPGDGNDARDAILRPQSDAHGDAEAVQAAAAQWSCFSCRGTDCWQDAYGNRKCRACHPPPDKRMAVQPPET